jgi:hypothetical protein
VLDREEDIVNGTLNKVLEALLLDLVHEPVCLLSGRNDRVSGARACSHIVPPWLSNLYVEVDVAGCAPEGVVVCQIKSGAILDDPLIVSLLDLDNAGVRAVPDVNRICFAGCAGDSKSDSLSESVGGCHGHIVLEEI